MQTNTIPTDMEIIQEALMSASQQQQARGKSFPAGISNAMEVAIQNYIHMTMHTMLEGIINYLRASDASRMLEISRLEELERFTINDNIQKDGGWKG